MFKEDERKFLNWMGEITDNEDSFRVNARESMDFICKIMIAERSKFTTRELSRMKTQRRFDLLTKGWSLFQHSDDYHPIPKDSP